MITGDTTEEVSLLLVATDGVGKLTGLIIKMNL